MSDDPNQPVLLTTAPNESKAAILVAALDAHGVTAQVTGGVTAGLRDLAPSEVRILVRHCDFARAREALNEIMKEAGGQDP